jgi:hypothetical protein
MIPILNRSGQVAQVMGSLGEFLEVSVVITTTIFEAIRNVEQPASNGLSSIVSPPRLMLVGVGLEEHPPLLVLPRECKIGQLRQAYKLRGQQTAGRGRMYIIHRRLQSSNMLQTSAVKSKFSQSSSNEHLP